jgi:hypothetical protein
MPVNRVPRSRKRSKSSILQLILCAYLTDSTLFQVVSSSESSHDGQSLLEDTSSDSDSMPVNRVPRSRKRSKYSTLLVYVYSTDPILLQVVLSTDDSDHSEPLHQRKRRKYSNHYHASCLLSTRIDYLMIIIIIS